MNGRRRDDTPHGDLPEDVQPGDYWRVTSRETGEPLIVDEPSNLTGGVWMVSAPIGDPGTGMIGTLTKHTVREHDDGTISVAPDDGSTNSILISRPNGASWHGYIERGVWRQV